MPLGLAWLVAVIGVAALVFSVLSKSNKKRRITVGIIGALILLASLIYTVLSLIFINSI